MTTPLPTADTLPESLREYDQWICWRSETRGDAQTKVPINPSTGHFASTTDPATWTAFDIAHQFARTDEADGIGFVFTEEDPFVGVDLDHCRVAETETIHVWAQAIIDALASYTEVSPSGTGVHVLVHGSLPEGGNRSGDVELYEAARFFTVTGAHVQGTPDTINERTDELRAVHREHIGGPAEEEATPTPQQPSGPSELADEDLIERAQQAANGQKFTGLWSGSTAGYDSHSEADMALNSMLAFWSGGDATQMDRLFRDSGLYRSKWDEVHFADGSTYGEKTLERAIAGTSDFYTPSRSASAEPEGSAGENSQAELIKGLQQELNQLSQTLTDRRETIESLVAEVQSLEETNAELRDELETARAATPEEPESADGSESIWTRLFR
ncbi:hypothetical protein ACFPYI_19210 [Halomarina salina]|uniref:NrS-1 polymerase-like HBD domain-containing protein n=1 Tax=Halomarina salina TaxID=1872699 RepID=A0ABD5RSM4_9EURY|nr:hypothetical protein [Halomarina salina]